MKCSVTFRHMKASESIRAYAADRVAKISRLLDRGGEALVTLSVERHQREAHIELVTDGSVRLRGVDKSEDLYASIDAAVDRIIRQVKRYRKRLQNHRARSGGRELGHQILAVEP
ncbi:MAG: ribosome-associated translation inhibitor RaiA, partial [Myxococcota bacterium]